MYRLHYIYCFAENIYPQSIEASIVGVHVGIIHSGFLLQF
jgi:hypothetical protein